MDATTTSRVRRLPADEVLAKITPAAGAPKTKPSYPAPKVSSSSSSSSAAPSQSGNKETKGTMETKEAQNGISSTMVAAVATKGSAVPSVGADADADADVVIASEPQPQPTSGTDVVMESVHPSTPEPPFSPALSPAPHPDSNRQPPSTNGVKKEPEASDEVVDLEAEATSGGSKYTAADAEEITEKMTDPDYLATDEEVACLRSRSERPWLP